jgi:hypothetical protein
VVDPNVHDIRIDREATEQRRIELTGRQLPEGYGPGEVHPDGWRTGELLAAGIHRHPH